MLPGKIPVLNQHKMEQQSPGILIDEKKSNVIMLGQQIYFHVIFAVLFIWKLTVANPVTNVQSQTGEINVRIDVDDVQIVALLGKDILDDYTDYNYSYDYADFTIKPVVKPTNSTSSSTTVKPWTTWPTVSPITSSSPSSSSSVADVEITSSITNSSSIAITSPSSLIDQAENISTTIVKDESNVTVTTSTIDTFTKNEDDHETQSENKSDIFTKVSAKRCRRGTLPDGNGRCRKINRRRTSFLPLAMKLVPKLTEGTGKNLHVAPWMTPRS